jgi:hypothetical protein
MIAVDWGSLDETFLVWRIEGNWTLAEFQATHFLSSRMIASKAYPVDVIVDIRTAGLQTNFLAAVLEIHRYQSPKNVGKTIILYYNDFIRRMFTLVENFYPRFSKDFIFTVSVDEAYLLVLPAA